MRKNFATKIASPALAVAAAAGIALSAAPTASASTFAGGATCHGAQTSCMDWPGFVKNWNGNVNFWMDVSTQRANKSQTFVVYDRTANRTLTTFRFNSNDKTRYLALVGVPYGHHISMGIVGPRLEAGSGETFAAYHN